MKKQKLHHHKTECANMEHDCHVEDKHLRPITRSKQEIVQRQTITVTNTLDFSNDQYFKQIHCIRIWTASTVWGSSKNGTKNEKITLQLRSRKKMKTKPAHCSCILAVILLGELHFDNYPISKSGTTISYILNTFRGCGEDEKMVK